jgi:demethylmenaquinone methyltransferase/2-methoxy-6-polyprenyl-1,4-benzoquinol methylase
MVLVLDPGAPREVPMARTDPASTSSPADPVDAYSRDARQYDVRTGRFEVYRRRAVHLLPVEPGDVVADVGCGTGLCFEQLVARVGPGGCVVGVEPAAEMRALAAQRIAERGWTNVVLVGSPVETAALPTVDHALFCAVHDVLQSPAALDNVLAHLRDGGGVVATGGKWAPAWAVAMNAGVLALHGPFVRDFAGFHRPWALLAQRVPGLTVEEVAYGAGFLARGNVRRDQV